MSHSVFGAEPEARVAPRVNALFIAVFFGFAISLALCWPQALEIWRTGNFHDTDDAMRMAQVRDLLAGQSWYDMNQWRLDPPRGSFMHWSRVVDAPIALLTLAFRLFTTAERAELLTRLVFPLSLQAALLFSTAWLGRVIAGPRALVPAVALTVLSGFMLGQFVPGRVDHHAPQIVLVVLASAATLQALDPARAKFAVITALYMAISLSISIENLHFFAVLGAALPLAWIARGEAMRPALLRFGLGLGVALLVCFLLFNGPSRWFVAACDAFSIVTLCAGLLGALTCCALGVFSRAFSRAIHRAACVSVCAIVGAAILALAFPRCMGDPFVDIDPLAREVWLANVTEVRTLRQVLAIFPDAWPMLTLPAGLGIIALSFGVWLERGPGRARLLALTALCVAGAAVACLAIRAASSLAPLTLMGGVVMATKLLERQRRVGVFLAGLATLPFAPIFWALAAPAGENPVEAARLRGGEVCRQASAYAPLALLPKGLVFAPIDSGAHLLAHTPHGVIGAPYHRNNHGNRAVLDGFLAPPSQARALVAGSGAAYVAICPGQRQLEVMVLRAPDGLAGALSRGEVPDWLTQLDVPGTPYKVFAPR